MIGDSWVTPRDWAPGETLTAANMDTYVSGNTLQNHSDILSLASFGLAFPIGNGAGEISVGAYEDIEIPFGFSVDGWILETRDAAGDLVVDVMEGAYADLPLSTADSIAGTEKPTLSSAQKAQDLSLSTWTTNGSAGNWLGWEVISVSGITQATLSLRMTRT